MDPSGLLAKFLEGASAHAQSVLLDTADIDPGAVVGEDDTADLTVVASDNDDLLDPARDLALCLWPTAGDCGVEAQGEGAEPIVESL